MDRHPIDRVVTLGPAVGPADLAALWAAGATWWRLNLSHAQPAWLEAVLTAAAGLGPDGPRVVADLPGRKARTGTLVGPAECRVGDRVWVGDPDAAPPGWLAIPLAIPPGRPSPAPGVEVVLRDGRLRLSVERTGQRGWECQVRRGGQVLSRMGLVVAGLDAADLAPPFPSAAVECCLAAGVRAFLVSYAESPGDLAAVRAWLPAGSGEVELIPKVETRPGVEGLTDMLGVCGRVCLARGDLGVQMPPEEVGWVEVDLLAAAGRRVWVAGEVLAGMTDGSPARRAELAAIWYALVHGAGGFVLSDETAMGAAPVAAVTTLAGVVAAWRVVGSPPLSRAGSGRWPSPVPES